MNNIKRTTPCEPQRSAAAKLLRSVDSSIKAIHGRSKPCYALTPLSIHPMLLIDASTLTSSKNSLMIWSSDVRRYLLHRLLLTFFADTSTRDRRRQVLRRQEALPSRAQRGPGCATWSTKHTAWPTRTDCVRFGIRMADNAFRLHVWLIELAT